MQITPRDLSYFLAIARHGRLGPAAKACHVTQPALTKAMKRLEGECGFQLFDRDSNGTRLTIEGARFMQVAEELDRKYKEAFRFAADIRAQQTGQLRVGSTDIGRENLASAALALLRRHRPGLRAVLKVGTAESLAQAVVDGALDVAVVSMFGEPPAACDAMKIGEEVHFPIASTKHPLAHHEHLQTPLNLSQSSWVYASSDGAGLQNLALLFKGFDLQAPMLSVEIEFMSDAILSLVRASDMLAMVSQTLYRNSDQYGLARIKHPAFQMRCPIFCLRRRNADQMPLIDDFCKLFENRAVVQSVE